MRKLEDILDDYESLRQSFRDFSKNGDANKEAYSEFQHRFIDLKADLRPWHTKMLSYSEARSDKNSTAIKMRIAVAMIKGEYTFSDNEKPMYEKPPSISNADKYAAATTQYKEFLQQKTFYKESFINISDLREDIQNFIILCRSRIN